jgi:hypothetical protein
VPGIYKGVPAYACGLYDEIRDKPGAHLSPAFGAGCCSDLFNDDRERVLRAVRERLDSFADGFVEAIHRDTERFSK